MKQQIKLFVAVLIAVMMAVPTMAAKKKTTAQEPDRKVWADLCYKIARPVLENMSKGNFQKDFTLELSPKWDGRDTRVAYLEAFARLMAGISPWIALPDDGTPEGAQRKQLHTWAIQAYKNAVDPNFNDKGYLQLGFAGHQPGLANYYSNNGSLYMTSLVFMPLGLPANHPFWTAPAEQWTSQKAWSGQQFPEDYHTSLRK